MSGVARQCLRGEAALAIHKELYDFSDWDSATLRRRLLGVLAATGLGGVTAVA